MTLATLSRIIEPIIAPARTLLRSLPTHKTSIIEMAGGPENGTPLCLPSDLARIEELKATEPLFGIVVEPITMKRNTRTYYLGANGRVSQRPRLVGTIIALTRATTTKEALGKFEQELNNGACYSTSLDMEPHIGEHYTEKCNRITRKHTAFSGFFEMVAAKGSYRPSIDTRVPELRWLADQYDFTQRTLGDPRRAFRYGGKECYSTKRVR